MPSLNQPIIRFQLKYQDLASTHYWNIWVWNALSEPKNYEIKMADLLLPGMVQYQILSQSRFRARTWRFCEIMMSFNGDTPQNRGFLMILCTISCRNVHYNTLNESNDTCFVQNFNKSLSPPTSPPPSLPHPHSPTSLPTAICVLQSLVKSFSYPPLTLTPCPQPPVSGPAPHILIIFA